MQVSSIQTCGNVKSITVKDSLWNKHTTHNYTVSNDKFDEFSAQIQDEAVSWKKKTRMTMILGTAAGAIVGAAASKKCRYLFPRNWPILSDKSSLVNGPVAIIIFSVSGILVISLLIKVI